MDIYNTNMYKNVTGKHKLYGSGDPYTAELKQLLKDIDFSFRFCDIRTKDRKNLIELNYLHAAARRTPSVPWLISSDGDEIGGYEAVIDYIESM